MNIFHIKILNVYTTFAKLSKKIKSEFLSRMSKIDTVRGKILCMISEYFFYVIFRACLMNLNAILSY